MSSPLSPEVAERYGAIVFLNVPSNLEIGVDYSKWRPSSEQEIWVMSALRPGAHFIYWNRDEKLDYIQLGSFVYISQREVVVFRWSKRCFLRVYDEDEVARYQLGHDNLSLLSKAVAYPAELVQPWSDVTYAISRVAITMFQGKELSSNQEDDLEEYIDASESKFDERPGQSVGDRPFSDIPNKVKQRRVPPTGAETASLADISAAGMDRSSDLQIVLGQYEANLEASKSSVPSFERAEFEALAGQLNLTLAECLLLSELQIAYISFLLAASLQAQVQWKELLVLLGNCECLGQKQASLGAEVLRLLYGQISQIPDDFILSEISQSNFIIWTLMSLSEICRDSASPKIQRRLRILEELVVRKFKMSIVELWALQEDGPQIVDVVESAEH